MQLRHSHTGLLIAVTKAAAQADPTALGLELVDQAQTGSAELTGFKVLPGFKASKPGDYGVHLAAPSSPLIIGCCSLL